MKKFLIGSLLVLVLLCVSTITIFACHRINRTTHETPFSLSLGSTPRSVTPTPYPKLLWGVYPGVDGSAGLTDFEQTVGTSADIYATFVSWGNEKDFPSQDSVFVSNAGKTLLIYWEPNDYTNSSVDQPDYNYDSILSGTWDAYFTQFAADAKSYGGKVLLAPFVEANDNSTPWGAYVNGNTPQKYQEAFRYVHDFFKSDANVSFVWVMNNVSTPEGSNNTMEMYYPGDAYVDYAGVDGFNFGNPWQSWDDVFDTALTTLSQYNKPILITSMSCAQGDQKAQWITDGLGKSIHNYPLVVGWIWFNENKEKDWRINSDSMSLTAFQQVVN